MNFRIPNITPGPWRYGTAGAAMRGYSQSWAVVASAAPVLIAGSFSDTPGGDAAAEANARLISHAPKLAEHLHRLMTQLARAEGCLAGVASKEVTDNMAAERIAARSVLRAAGAEGAGL
jgi:hypothetical protein